MPLQTVSTDRAPAAIGPYSQAVVAGDFVYVSGQIALDPGGAGVVGETAAEQARQCMANLLAVLEAAGCGASQVVKCTIYLTDLGDFGTVNEVYGSYFTESPPARACVEVSRLPKDVQVEIDAIAFKG